MTNLVGFGYIGADGVNGARSYYPTNISNYQAFGLGVVQTTGIGKFSANYTPHSNNGAASNDIFNTNARNSGGTANSSYEITYTGNLGLNGLTVLGSYMSWPKAVIVTTAGSGNPTLDAKSSRVAAKYNFGQFTAAIDRSREENVQAMTATVAGAQKFNGDSYAVAYAINKELSVGLTYAEAKSDNGAVVTTAGKKETTVIAAIGYNLGPVAVSTQYKNVQNLSGLSANDGQQLGVWVNTNF
jgi:predicted porin